MISELRIACLHEMTNNHLFFLTKCKFVPKMCGNFMCFFRSEKDVYICVLILMYLDTKYCLGTSEFT
jgi:hypothetical protein